MQESQCSSQPKSKLLHKTKNGLFCNLNLLSPINQPYRNRKTHSLISLLIAISDPDKQLIEEKMPQGTLEVLLVGAKGLQDSDFLSKMDPYVSIICRTQEQKSSIASGKGYEAEWNETFVFTISEGTSEIILKIMDHDRLTDDDFLGEAIIPLEPVFMEGSLPPSTYNVVKEQEYCGEIRIGLKFTPECLGYNKSF